MIPTLPPLPVSVPAARLPTWTLDKLWRRPCPVCDSDNPQAVVERPDRLIVHKCTDCEMLYLADVPSQKEIQQFYSQYASFKGFRGTAGLLAWLRHWLSARKNRHIDILNNSGGIKSFSVCEIGCSYGGFLELIRHRGGSVYGVELDAESIEFMQDIGIPCGEAIKLSMRFDITCLLQVLEHLTTPAQTISHISQTLEPDGRLLISVPNGGQYTQVGPSWIGFRVDLEHLNYFDIRSLSNLLAQHGLYVDQFWEHAQPGLRPPDETSNRNWYSRIWGKLAGLMRLMKKGPLYEPGSFVLTVLARKA